MMKNIAPTRATADHTRKSILLAARQLFIKKGFAGTSISQIAKLAKVNQSLIYHHFANKESLWVAVKREVLEMFVEEGGVAIEDILHMQDPIQVIENLVRFRFDICDKFPDFRRLMDWQFLEPNPYEMRSMKLETFNLLIALIENFQNQNRINPYYTADLILAYIFHVPAGFFKAYKNLSKGYSGDALVKRKQDYIQLCIDSLVKSLIIPEKSFLL